MARATSGLVFEQKLIFERGAPGRRGMDIPKCDVPQKPLEDLIPSNMIRDQIEGFPEVSELEAIRHFTGLSQLNFAVDLTMIPLGSCTMKENPPVNELMASLPQFAHLHPLSPSDMTQGAFELMWRLQEALKEILGMAAVNLNPAAGAQGELTGLMMIKAALRDRGEHRTKILIPDSAHGTNPASAAFCGYKAVEIKSGPDGILEAKDVEELMDEDTAGIMLTNPNTLGLFEKNIIEIARIVHERGGYVYCDGANLNAILGIARPGDMGVDVVHTNLHKTFSTPHGGGGPGAGPVGVSSALEPYLPMPQIVRRGHLRPSFRVRTLSPRSIGRIRSFYGQFGVFVRAYAYIRSLGPEGLCEVAEIAVLNANYIRVSLQDAYDIPYNSQGCMHECVLSDKKQKKHGVTTDDIAKMLLDGGVYAPTVHFPLTVPGAMMIEPTETEPKESIDGFIEDMLTIAKTAEENPELVTGAPHLTHMRRIPRKIRVDADKEGADLIYEPPPP